MASPDESVSRPATGDAYEYTRTTVYRELRKVHTEKRKITGVELYKATGNSGRYAFASLINKWNQIGLLGLENGGPVYVFTIDEESR